MNVGIIVAAGKSSRMGANIDKSFFSLGSKPVVVYAMEAFERCDDIDWVVVVVRKEKIDAVWSASKMFGCKKIRFVVEGGASRQLSVQNGLAQTGDDVKIVAIHDGARPCVTPSLISETVQSAKRLGSGVAAVEIADTVKYVERGRTVTRTIDRTKLWAVQTPQSFKRKLILDAYAKVNETGAAVTDDASAVELVSDNVRLVPSSGRNLKITTIEDMAIATALLKE